MPVEIERKFLVASDTWRAAIVASERLRDGLIGEYDGSKVRVRCGETRSTLAVKGPRLGAQRMEFEYEIPPSDAQAMLVALCGERRLEKTRHDVVHAGDLWRVDVYEGRLAGLVLAEIELSHEGQAFERPDWLGPEVTNDPRFGKRSLFRWSFVSRRPFVLAEFLAAVAGAEQSE
jgi:CYTH domain-containing protein